MRLIRIIPFVEEMLFRFVTPIHTLSLTHTHTQVTDADENIRLRAGLCSAVTGQDHPFVEELLDRDPENARAFVGEVRLRV